MRGGKAVEAGKARSVAPAARATRASLLCSFLCLFNLTCVQIDGGAVELYWSIRSFDGTALECPDVGLAEVQLCWEPVGDAGVVQVCSPERSATFPCADLHGVTTFQIPDGPTAMWIRPLCPGTQPPPRYVVPAAIVRDISHGEVAILNALLIVADRDACAQ